MRRSLSWALTAALVLSAAAIGWPRVTRPLVAAVQRADALSHIEQPAAHATPAARANQPALPATLPPWDLAAAVSDPFTGATPAPTPPTAMAPPPPPPVSTATPPPPPLVPTAAPAVLVRYLGSMQTPQGERLVLLLRGDTAIVARAGLGFEDGYVIQSVSPQAVRLLHAATGVGLDIAVPVSLDAAADNQAAEFVKPAVAASNQTTNTPTR